MSVINQMLKDLDKRQKKQSPDPAFSNQLQATAPTKKNVLMIVIMFVVVNILALLLWKLYSDNQSLRLQVKSSEGIKASKQSGVNKRPDIETKSVNKKAVLSNKQASAETLPLAKKLPVDRTQAIAKIPGGAIAPLSVTPEQLLTASAEPVAVTASSANGIDLSAIKAAKQTAKQALAIANSTVTSAALGAVTNNAVTSKVKQVEEKAVNSGSASFSIARQQLSAQQLADNKLTQAQQALTNNQISKAETLLEDALLLVPTNKPARLQLAALWFGRQAYKNALNLLSQGIALDKDDGELRLMKARIYLKKGLAQPAYQVLAALAENKNIEYQLALASTAQQTGLFDAAIKSYLILLDLDPNNGRWWLGLAAAYDSSSQFKQATQAYQNSLLHDDLSEASIGFIHTRLQALAQ